MYLYNPSEPAGQPIQPVPVIPHNIANIATDALTRGRCGGCAACPQYWQMEVPFITGETWAQEYSGFVRLHRRPYNYVSDESDDSRWGRCHWQQAHHEESSQGLNDYHEAGFENDGWYLEFAYRNDLSAYQWYLYTPLETAGSNPVELHRSYYEFESNYQYFRCRSANIFVYRDRVAAQPFVYRPPVLSLFPVWP